jgi:Rrf2 family protein
MTLVSQSTEYALRAVVYLAAQHDRSRAATVISAATAVPSHYLSKLLKGLVRSGVLSARRGPGGGFALACSPDDLTVLDIVNAVDPLEHVRRCPLGRDPHGGVLCPLHAHLEDAIQGVENALRAATIGQLGRALTPDGVCAYEPDVHGR